MPPRADGTRLRVIATNDLLATVVPARTGGGTLDGVAALVEREREQGPVLWLDSGDFTGGPAWPLLGDRGWSAVSDVGVDAAVAGNHEFDEGPDALRTAAADLGFPILCANVDVGLAPATLLETPGAVVGVIGLTHPHVHQLALAPEPGDDTDGLVRELAARLRADGADRIIVLQHDGADWWPTRAGIGATARRWTAAATWADAVDVVLGGHTLGAWAGRAGATPCGHAYPMASSVLVADLTARGAVLRGVVAVAPWPPGSASRRHLAEGLGRAADDVIGWNPQAWSSAGEQYLPDRVAAAVRWHAGCDAAFLPAHCFFTQAPLDGVVAHLAAGEVTALDLHRLFAFPDDTVAVLELEVGDLARLRARHDAVAAPGCRAGDGEWWNWARSRAGVAAGGEGAQTVAVPGHTVPLIAHWLGRSVRPAASVAARTALRAWFGR